MAPEPVQLLTLRNMCQTFGVTRQTIWNWVRRGELLEPVRVNGRRAYWRADDVGMWVRRHPPTRFKYFPGAFPWERRGE